MSTQTAATLSSASAALPGRVRPLDALRWLGTVLAGSWLLAASSYVSVSMLPFSPVPVTAQSLAVLLLGVILGPRGAAAAVLAYLGQGAAGLPVFAGGAAGAGHLIGPTAGYLIGFLPAAILVGWLHRAGWTRTWHTAAAAFALGTAVIFAFGLTGLALHARTLGLTSASAILAIGLYPYLPGGVIKIALAMAFLPRPARAAARRS
jgi:biotin transport system substrate-specific component